MNTQLGKLEAALALNGIVKSAARGDMLKLMARRLGFIDQGAMQQLQKGVQTGVSRFVDGGTADKKEIITRAARSSGLEKLLRTRNWDHGGVLAEPLRDALDPAYLALKNPPTRNKDFNAVNLFGRLLKSRDVRKLINTGERPLVATAFGGADGTALAAEAAVLRRSLAPTKPSHY